MLNNIAAVTKIILFTAIMLDPPLRTNDSLAFSDNVVELTRSLQAKQK